MNNKTFEQALRIMQCVANNAASGHEYKEFWGNDFRAKEISDLIEKVKNSKEYGQDFWNAVFALPEEQKRFLGFLKMSKEDKHMLIPIWIWACLPDDMPIGGNAGGELKKNLDSDTRFGCVWWRV